MKAYQLALSVAATAVIITGCGEEGASSSSEPVVQEAVHQNDLVALQSGRFIDSAVSGLQYSCNPSGRTGVTNSSGIFTCNSGDLISFYIAENFIGSAILQDIVTPKTFYPNNEEAMINLAQLLQTLDEDSNPDNGIVIDNEKTARLLNRDLDFEDGNFDDAVEGYLLESLINGEAARQHLEHTLIVLNGGSLEDSGLEEPELEEDATAEVDEGVDTPAPEVELEEPELEEDAIAEVDEGIDTPEPEAEEDSLPEDLGIETPEESDDGSSSSTGWRPDVGINPDDLVPDPSVFERPELNLDMAGSSSSEGSSSSIGVYIPDVNIADGIGSLIPEEIDLGGITIPSFINADEFRATLATYISPLADEMDTACVEEYGVGSIGADWNQIEQLSSTNTDMEAFILSTWLTVGAKAYIKNDGEVEVPDVPMSEHYVFSYNNDYIGEIDIDNGIELSGYSTFLATFYNRGASVLCYIPSH